MKALRRHLTVTNILTAVLMAFVLYRIGPQIAALAGIDHRGEPAPEFTLVTLGGEPISLARLRGQVVLVNFWATWCAPCRVEMPGFQEVYDERRGDGFTVVGVATDAEGRAVVERFLEERRVSYPIALATPAVRSAFGGVSLLPSSFLIDRKGRIRHHVEGFFTKTALSRAVGRLLAEGAEGPS